MMDSDDAPNESTRPRMRPRMMSPRSRIIYSDDAPMRSDGAPTESLRSQMMPLAFEDSDQTPTESCLRWKGSLQVPWEIILENSTVITREWNVVAGIRRATTSMSYSKHTCQSMTTRAAWISTTSWGP